MDIHDKVFLALITARQALLDNDVNILEDTKPMVPYLKRMMNHGIISYDGQGAVNCDRYRYRQRPYLDLLIPTMIHERFELGVGFVRDLVGAGFVVVHDEWGLIVPPSVKKLVTARSGAFSRFLADNYVLSDVDKSMLGFDARAIDYAIPVTESTSGDGPGTWVMLCERSTTETVLRTDFSEWISPLAICHGTTPEESINQLRHRVERVTIIDPNWPTDAKHAEQQTIQFIERICDAFVTRFPINASVCAPHSST